jgi:hypothetical protein
MAGHDDRSARPPLVLEKIPTICPAMADRPAKTPRKCLVIHGWFLKNNGLAVKHRQKQAETSLDKPE